MKIKKIISLIVTGALMVTALSSVIASEITDPSDEGYEGVIWQAIEDGGEFVVEPDSTGEIYADVEFSDEPDFTSDANGSAKVTWNTKNKTNINIKLSSNEIPQKYQKAVKAVSVDVYVPEELESGEENPAIGSTLSGYIEDDLGRYLNGSYSWCEERTLEAGWNTVMFDAVNGNKLWFMIWKNTAQSGVIYLDNMIAYYQSPTSVFDSFENYDEDWAKGNWNLSKNTDPAYVKDGKASMKIECTSTGENYAFKSKFLNLSGVNGKQVPKIEGYTPKTFGFWVYSDGASAQFKPNGTESWQYVTGEGWTYVAWNIPASSGTWYNWDMDHFNQMIMKVTGTGNLYIDAMTIGYQNDNETVLDGFEQFSWTAGGCYGADGYGVNMDYTYVKDGIGSGKFVIPANKSFDNGEYVYSNNGLGITIPKKEGKVIKKIGMWVYGTGVEGTYLRPGFHSETDNSYRPFGEIDLNFDGWKYIEANVSSETTKFYNIQVKNSTDQDAVFYVDKVVAEYVNEGTNIWSNELKNGNASLDMRYIEKDDVLSYDVVIDKTSDMNYDILVMIAGYDGDGNLIKAETAIIGANETGEIKKSAQMEIASSYEANIIQKVKGFIWKGDTVEPLAECAVK